MAYEDITLNSVYLNVRTLSPVKKQKTIKQVVGKTLSELKVIGVAEHQWELQVSGMVFGTTAANVATNRTSIENLDDTTPYAFVDGIHNGTYYVRPGSLRFEDSEEDVNMSYNYSVSLVEQ